MKRGKLDIPDDWPRPWTELGEGKFVLFGWLILYWKKYKRKTKFTIYGFSRSYYMRIWYGKKVVHFKLFFQRLKKDT
jgi:hypothetical protein